MAMATKRDYKAIAEVVAAEAVICEGTLAQYTVRNIMHSLADKFAQGNRRFNRESFYQACGFSDDGYTYTRKAV